MNFIVIFSLFLLSSTLAFAQSSTDIRVETEGDFEDGTSSRIEVREERGIDGTREIREEKLNVKGNKFEISGRVTAVLDNGFIISGNVIFVDQKTDLRAGETVKAKGLIIDNKMFAEEVVVLKREETSSQVPNVFSRIMNFLGINK